MSASRDCGPPACVLGERFGGESISIRVTILASGSSGNCTLLETSRTRLLVDAGLGKRETLRRLAVAQALHQALVESQNVESQNGDGPRAEAPSTPSEPSEPFADHLDGIVISHEHSDH